MLRCGENQGALRAFRESLFSQEIQVSFPIAVYFKGGRGSSFVHQPCHRPAARAFLCRVKRVLQHSRCCGAQRWGGMTQRMRVFRWPHPALPPAASPLSPSELCRCRVQPLGNSHQLQRSSLKSYIFLLPISETTAVCLMHQLSRVEAETI